MLPIKQLLFTFAPAVPIQITLVPVVTPEPAEISQSCVGVAGGISKKRPLPMAVFPPVVLLRRALAPLAVLKLPVVCHRVQRDRWRCWNPGSVVKKGRTLQWLCCCVGSVIQKRPGACCRVGVCGVGKKRPSADGRIEVPILLLLIENQPIAVLFVPLVR